MRTNEFPEKIKELLLYLKLWFNVDGLDIHEAVDRLSRLKQPICQTLLIELNPFDNHFSWTISIQSKGNEFIVNLETAMVSTINPTDLSINDELCILTQVRLRSPKPELSPDPKTINPYMTMFGSVNCVW